MSRRVLLVVTLFFIGTAALVAERFGLLLLPFDVETGEAPRVAKTEDPKAPSAAKPAEPDEPEALRAAGPPTTVSDASLDISRISPTGSSVFAGQAQPNSYVTVFEDGKPVASVKADENGEWSLVTEHRFASLEPNLAIKAGTEPPPTAPAAQVADGAKAAKSQTQAANASPEAVAKELMTGFEKLVAEAREEAKAAEAKPPASAPASPPSAAPVAPVTPAAKPAPESTGAPIPEARVAEVAPKTESKTETAKDVPAQSAPPAAQRADAGEALRPVPAPASTSIPVPIMFVYNEAQFTDDGQRAASLLLEYLKLKHLNSISLSGHADERGSDAYNMDLSRERLDAVARYLRDGGYSGALDLVPKGKSEPFSGIDRRKFSGEALYQLDRRVELHIFR